MGRRWAHLSPKGREGRRLSDDPDTILDGEESRSVSLCYRFPAFWVRRVMRTRTRNEGPRAGPGSLRGAERHGNSLRRAFERVLIKTRHEDCLKTLLIPAKVELVNL